MNSFIDCFKELEVQLAVITETWFGDSDELESNLDDLLHATGILTITRNRQSVNGVCYSGVAICYRASNVVLKDLKYWNPDNYETLMVAGSIKGHSRKLVVIAAYMPSGDRQGRGRACLDHIGEMISEAKRRFNEPMIVLAWDFNQWGIEQVVADYVDLLEAEAGPS